MVPMSEVALAEQVQVDDRMRLGQLPDDEEAQRDGGNDRQCHDERGIEPVELVALVEQDLQGTDTDDQQRQTDAINGHYASLGFRGACSSCQVRKAEKIPTGMLM